MLCYLLKKCRVSPTSGIRNKISTVSYSWSRPKHISVSDQAENNLNSLFKTRPVSSPNMLCLLFSYQWETVSSHGEIEFVASLLLLYKVMHGRKDASFHFLPSQKRYQTPDPIASPLSGIPEFHGYRTK